LQLLWRHLATGQPELVTLARAPLVALKRFKAAGLEPPFPYVMTKFDAAYFEL